MDREPYSPPAWPGLTPVAPHYERATPAQAAEISGALGRTGVVWRLANAGEFAAVFRFDDNDGARCFVKIVPAARWPAVQRGEQIGRFLQAAGAPAVAALAPDPPALASGDRVISYPFSDGRSPNAGADDARRLGAALAALHRALASHPDRGTWRTATDERLRRLIAIRAELAAGRLQAGPEPARLMAMSADTSVSFLPDAFQDLSPASPLHGDLNIFNILVEGDRVVFLDFEDVAHSVLPAGFDVALLCERAILAAEPDDTRARGSIGTLLTTYEEGSDIALNRQVMPQVLRGLALRSLCTLATIDPGGTDPEEWRKFFHLFAAAADRRGVFA